MGLFHKGYPYYVMNKYFTGRGESSFPKGVVFRYVCPNCNKHFNEKVPELSPRYMLGIPLRRSCSSCGRKLKVENVFEDRRNR
jgi:predicted RNA-binding Zn-ribbon protein involved in translation (DUF1610 family)